MFADLVGDASKLPGWIGVLPRRTPPRPWRRCCPTTAPSPSRWARRSLWGHVHPQRRARGPAAQVCEAGVPQSEGDCMNGFGRPYREDGAPLTAPPARSAAWLEREIRPDVAALSAEEEATLA